MWFPGSRLVVEVDAHPPNPLPSLLRRCVETRLNGYLEVFFSEVEGIVLFHSGDVVNITSMSDDGVQLGREALIALARQSRTQAGSACIHEIPPELAEMLHGLHGRVETAGVRSSDEAKQILETMKDQVHTGAVELHLNMGNAIVLFKEGEFLNCYFRTESGSTFENREALHEVFDCLDLSDSDGRVFASTYSSEVARTRKGWDLFEELETLA